MADLDELLLGMEEEGDDEEVMTAGGVLREIEEAWVNEKLSPELLPHKNDYVEALMEQLEAMESNLSGLEASDLRCALHRQEVERIRFVVSSYLRCRLAKIQTQALYLLSRQEDLSHQEQVFLASYARITAHTLNDILDKLPRVLSNFNASEMEEGPDLDTHVVIKSKLIAPESVIVTDLSGEEEVVSLRDGSQHIIPYSVVRHLVRTSKVNLF